MTIKTYEMRNIRTLKNISMNLTHDLRCRHAAMLTVGSKIISIGVNKAKSDPLQKKYTRLAHLTWTHAEVDCLKGVEINLKRATLYVVRTDVKGNFMESCPCSGCQGLINDLQISRIVHSTSDGSIIEIIKNIKA
jgi:deoxycytidylate deaminase